MENRTHYPDSSISPEGVPGYLVATPYYGACDFDHLQGYQRLLREYPCMRAPFVPEGQTEATAKGRVYRVLSCPYIDVARGVAAQVALERGFEGLFFIDHDIIFDPQDVIAMMREAHREQAVVYQLYSMRTSGKRSIGALDPSIKRATFHKGGGLYPGLYGGFGFTAIPRSVLEAVSKDMLELDAGWAKLKGIFSLRSGFPDWRELKDALWAAGALTDNHRVDQDATWQRVIREISGNDYAGEDISFFHRVRRLGLKVLADTRPVIAHKGTYSYGLEDVQLCVPRFQTLDIEFRAITEPRERQRIEAVVSEHFEGLTDIRAAE